MQYYKTLIVLVLLSQASVTLAVVKAAINIRDLEGQFFGKKIYYLRQNLLPKEAMDPMRERDFKLGQSDLLSFVGDKTVWLRFTLYNPYDTPKEIYLKTPSSFGTMTSIYREGRRFSNLAHNRRNQERVIEIQIPPRSTQTYFVRNFSPHAHTIAWKFWLSERRLLEEKFYQSSVLQGIFTIGSMTVLFNVMLLIAFRKLDQIYYIAHVGFFLFFTVVAAGLSGDAVVNYLGSLSLIVSSLLLTLFLIEFLDLKRYRSGELWLARGILAFYSCLALLYPADDVLALTIFALGSPLAMILSLFISAAQIMKERANSYMIGIGFLALCIGASLQVGRFTDFAMFEGVSTWIYWYAYGVANVFLLLALGRKLAAMERARRYKHMALGDQFEQLNQSQEQLARVFYPHQVAAMQSGQALVNTMPTEIGRGYVISLQLKPLGDTDDIRDSLRRYLQRCGSLCQEEYDKESLQARAFRWRELGSRLICTVGFPFSTPMGRTPADSAVQLAEEFIEILQQEFHELLHDRVTCRIGVAGGTIEGSFSQTHPVVYDLSGLALDQADRYQKIGDHRDLGQDIQGHGIILQNSVYEAIDSALQSRYLEINLQDLGIQVRDDRDAKSLYVRSYGAPSTLSLGA